MLKKILVMSVMLLSTALLNSSLTESSAMEKKACVFEEDQKANILPVNAKIINNFGNATVTRENSDVFEKNDEKKSDIINSYKLDELNKQNSINSINNNSGNKDKDMKIENNNSKKKRYEYSSEEERIAKEDEFETLKQGLGISDDEDFSLQELRERAARVEITKCQFLVEIKDSDNCKDINCALFYYLIVFKNDSDAFTFGPFLYSLMKALTNYYDSLIPLVTRRLPNAFSKIFGKEYSEKYSEEYLSNVDHLQDAGKELYEWILKNNPSILESYI